MYKKRTIRIREEKTGGYYVEYYAGKTLIATKEPTDAKVLKHYRSLLKSELDEEAKDGVRLAIKMLYEWRVDFKDNPAFLRTLKKAKAAGLDPKWKGVNCPLWVAKEIADAK